MKLKEKFRGLSRLTRITWILFIALVLIIPIYYWSVKVNLFNLYGELPSLESLENPDPVLASLLISSDGKTLDKYFQLNRNPVDYDELSPYLEQALVGTEDRRFYSHSGIDLIGLTRAFVSTVILMRNPQGGSTITQQLAKMLWETRSEEYQGILSKIPYLNLLIIKTKEWIIAVQIEKSYTKKEIISMYFNTMPFGNNTFGIKVAAETYFNKQPIHLQVHEAALLVGILNGPSFFNPVRHPERAQRRRNWVLRQMYKNGYITETTYQKALENGLDLKYRPQGRQDDLIAYLKGVLRTELRSWAAKNNFDLYQDGLKIYTTIDSRMQNYAEEAVQSHLRYLQNAFNAEWQGREPWAGDKDYIQRIWRNTDYYRQLVRRFGANSDSVRFYANLPRPQSVFSWDGEKEVNMSPLDSIRYYKKFLHTGFMAMNPSNGQIKAWVGGIDYNYFKYDHVKQGRNQPGSTFKPFVYTTAIANGYSPCFKIMDAPVTYEIPGADPPYWTPNNATDKYDGEFVTLKQALRRSMNR
ncbi:MAG: transglycosylase domain-containing protein, partial [Cyclobacteriaceae bacterium]